MHYLSPLSISLSSRCFFFLLRKLFGFFLFYSVNHILLCKSFIFIIIISSYLLFSLWLTNFFLLQIYKSKKATQTYLLYLFSLPRYMMKQRYIEYNESSFIITIRSPSRSCKDSRDRFDLLRRSSPLLRKLDEQQGPFFVSFHIWSLGFLVYSFMSQSFWFANIFFLNWLFIF